MKIQLKGDRIMLRSMYSGISGMKGFQTKLDVVGNNIANVNTAGYKKGRVTFQDLMSQTTSGAQGAAGGRGGINPVQVGTGSSLASIDNVHTQGFKETTDRPLDVMIEGDGYFTLELPNGGEAYTRAGNFSLDDEGRLVNANGYYVKGVNGEVPTDAKNIKINKDGEVTYTDNNDDEQTAGTMEITGFANPEGLEKAGENLWIQSPNSGTPEEITSSDIVAGSLEMSNVDLAEEFTNMITAQRGFQANTRIITTSDEILQELVNLKR